MPDLVRYQVLSIAFVNGHRVRPGGREPVYVMAEAGLESAALRLAPEGAKPSRTDKEPPPPMTAIAKPKLDGKVLPPDRRG